MESTELKVEMVALHEKRVRKCLSKVKGVERVEVEGSLQKVVVTGYANQSKILKALRRVGLRAEPWSPRNELLSAYAAGTGLMAANNNYYYSFF
uniref:HMA domain-containing protein n=1 Tax=Leersia perrieri TaxID=77586 RepID=A0A0D9X9N7_9ORYZ